MKISFQLKLTYCITFSLAACSLIYELLIAQAIVSFASNTVVWYSLTIGLFLASMGIGALCCERFCKNKRDWSALFAVEILLCIIGGLSVMIINSAHIAWGFFLVKGNFEYNVFMFFAIALSVIIIIGFLSGLELPLLIRIGNRLSTEKTITNRVLGADYFGALIGGVAFPLILLPHFELITISLLTASLNLLIAALILILFIEINRATFYSWANIVLLVVLLSFSLIKLDSLQQYFLKKFYFHHTSTENIYSLLSPMPDFPRIERYSSPYQKIDVVHYPKTEGSLANPIRRNYSQRWSENPIYDDNYRLYLNGDFQFGTFYEEIYHEYFAHVPIILQDHVPKNVLILGGGDGLLLRELLKHDEIQNIKLVDLDKEIVELAKTHPVLRTLNQDAFDDPRVLVNIGDAYQYMRHCNEEYDAIYMDFPDPNDYNVSKLYSHEFYQFIKKCLSPDGYAVFDATGAARFSMHDKWGQQQMIDQINDWDLYYHTLKSSGFETIIPYVTNLEVDNQEARKALLKLLLKNQLDVFKGNINTLPENQIARDLRLDRLIKQFVHDLQEGFIMVKKNPREFQYQYKDLDIQLFILNRKRFHLAFSLPYDFPTEIDQRKINSIMRPTLPNSSFWYVLKWP